MKRAMFVVAISLCGLVGCDVDDDGEDDLDPPGDAGIGGFPLPESDSGVDGPVDDPPDGGSPPEETPVESCAAVADGKGCVFGDGWIGSCRQQLCCWSCVAQAPGGGQCPYLDNESATITTGVCQTGRCWKSTTDFESIQHSACH